ncbi:SDR family oxidoreductase [Mariniphaga sediminis]|uniref:SDR family oxidoreductase n=1 Tax=Mariniphaga sediminis TaxID=1628158 RepID=A0A399CRQ2_9BACT|nr:SDR family oxidoreductase [Mariniphaga sediminis]RIH62834.1 SDR family oxidoreductase [Mariniphaga sediminis]
MNKKVVVTGASSGIGMATARRFASEGWDVCILARREENLKQLINEFPSGNHLVLAGDYSLPQTANDLRDLITDRWGELDAFVNCAGVSISGNPIDDELDEWNKPFKIMVDGAVYTTRVIAPFLSEGGRIIHITSIHGERVEKGSSAYAMAKAAINQYCRSLALELADKGILVNAIAPGFISTPMSINNGVNELETKWFRDNYVDGHHLPLRRAGQPDEIAGVAFFLAGKDATYITGQVITVDGGLTITF